MVFYLVGPFSFRLIRSSNVLDIQCRLTFLGSGNTTDINQNICDLPLPFREKVFNPFA